MTTNKSPNVLITAQSSICSALTGVGIIEPREAILRYYEAFGDIVGSWTDSPSVTSAQIEMCNAFSVLRYSLDRSEAPPEKHNSETAIKLISRYGIDRALGL